MDRRLGIKVVERDDLVILVDDGRGDRGWQFCRRCNHTWLVPFSRTKGNYIWSGWLERKVVVGVGDFAVGEHVVAVDVAKGTPRPSARHRTSGYAGS